MITQGRIVIYKLAEHDVQRVNYNRTKPGYEFSANSVSVGDEYPLIAVRIWPNEYYENGVGVPGVNGQVLLDGPDTLWVTSVREGSAVGQWHWPVRKTQLAAEENPKL